MSILPLTSRPRESLFDALNREPWQGVFIGWADGYTPTATELSLLYDVEGTTIEEYVPATGLYITQENFTVRGNWSGLTMDATITYGDGTSETVKMDSVSISGKYIVSIIVATGSIYMGAYTPDIDCSIIPGVNGIFDALAKLTSKAYFVDTMDADYLTTHSGSKAVSNAVLMYLIKYGEDVSDAPVKVLSMAGINALAKMIWQRYGDAWEKIYDALVEEYAPLENYSMTEETTPDLTDTFGVSDDYEKRVHTETNADVTTETGVYGFNSATAVPAGSSNTTGTGLNNNAENVETQTGTRTEKHTGKNTVKRNGNIGTVTAQQMLTEEINVRIKNHMDDIIFTDVDQLLTTAGFAPILSKTINII